MLASPAPAISSVIGFDDILVAEYPNPRLTTVRQPLHKMGSTAAELLVKRIQAPEQPFSDTVWFPPSSSFANPLQLPLLPNHIAPHPK